MDPKPSSFHAWRPPPPVRTKAVRNPKSDQRLVAPELLQLRGLGALHVLRPRPGLPLGGSLASERLGEALLAFFSRRGGAFLVCLAFACVLFLFIFFGGKGGVRAGSCKRVTAAGLLI